MAPYRTPISLHPAFPMIVALWFAALLGLGSLLVPAPLIERLVAASGISAIIPLAAPPLGFKARFVLSIAATLGGGLVGLIIARKVAGLHRREAPSPRFSQTVARSGVNARRPISAHDELGHIGLDGSSARGRRSLAIEVDEGPSELLEAGPLPGGQLKVKEMALPRPEPEDLTEPEVDSEPLELSGLELASLDGGVDHAPGFSMLADEDGHGEQPAARTHPTIRKTPAKPVHKQIFTPVAVEDEAVDQPAPADLHFSPPSLTRFASLDTPALGHTDEPTGVGATDGRAEDDLAALARQAKDRADGLGLDKCDSELEEPVASIHESDWQDGALEDLGLVQLAQRLGSSIEKRREARAAAAVAQMALSPVAPAPVTGAPVTGAPITGAPLADDFGMAEAEDAAEAMAAYFGKDAAPAAIQEPAPAPFVQPMAAAKSAPARQVFQPLTAEPAPAPPPSLSTDTFARIDIDDNDGDGEDGDETILNLAASFSLPLGRTGTTGAAAQSPAPQAVPAQFNPFERKAQVFVRIEDEPQPEDGHVEPAVVFPGEKTRMQPPAASVSFAPDGQPAARVDAEENEKALREALLNLQRMSGAA
jgi:hypothetical protein